MVEKEIGWRSPTDAFAPLSNETGAALFHGGDRAANARWSFIAANPVRRLEFIGGATLLDGAPSGLSPFEALERLTAERRSQRRALAGSAASAGAQNVTPFVSGIAGYVGYECGALAEPSAVGPPSPYTLPDLSFCAFDAVAAFDRVTQRAFVSGLTERAVAALAEKLGASRRQSSQKFSAGAATSNFSPAAYEAAVADVIQRIRKGDIFQANISQRLVASIGAGFSAYDLFCAGSTQSSAQFGAFLPLGAGNIASFSPERFFRTDLSNDGALKIIAEPIKGTRARGANEDEDRALLAALIADAKDRAENIMIADLTRNDLSRICLDGSIVEEAICEPVTHATLHHLVSRISGALREDVFPAAALAALFPCGSVTGAPKIEAMRTIAEIEKSGRGPYCGAIGYIDDSGVSDFSVAIRIGVFDDGRLSIPVGGGVTLRSDPQTEYRETMTKARHLLQWLDFGDGVR